MANFVRNQSFKRQFDNAVGLALEATVREWEDALRDSIESAVYFWPNETRRQNGQVVDSPRDIKDEGTFLRSQRALKVSLKRWEISWNVAYAVIILLGFQGPAGNSQPGRNWIDYSLKQIDLAKIFSEELKRWLR